MANPNLQMHEPFRIPQGWTGQERRLVAQMEEVFDDLYRRFGRLRIEDMGKDFQLTWFDMGDNIANFNGELYGDETRIGLTTRMEDAEGNVTSLWTNAHGLAAEISNSQGDINRLQITAQGMAAEISDAQGNINQLSVTARGLQAHMEDAENNINDLQITAQGYGIRLESAEGNITQLALTADGLAMRIEDTEGYVNELQETARAVTRRLSDAEGNITELAITAQGLDSRVQDAEGNVSTLIQRADVIEATVQNAQGDISVLQQTATDITAAVRDAQNNIGALQVTATDITAAVFDADGNYSGVNITSTGITIDASKTLEIKSGSKLKLESGGTLDITSTNFSVNSATQTASFTGTITADDGSIGGWTIGETELTASLIGLRSTTANNANTTIVFWAGSDTRSSAPFKVTKGGKLTASNVEITGGELDINNGLFSVDSLGYMTAKWGQIAGWNFDSNKFSRGTGATYVGMGYYEASSTAAYYYSGLWVGTSGNPIYAPVGMYLRHKNSDGTNDVFLQTARLLWMEYVSGSSTPVSHEINLAALYADYGV